MHKKIPRTQNVSQGNFAISDDPELVMTTILGSCVAVCLYDPKMRIGGINHFLLSGSRCDSASSCTMSCGLHMMELLINALLRKGAQRGNLQAKLFGGAQMINNSSKIGQENADFARTFLRHEGFLSQAESLGGDRARRIRFWPTTGKVQLKTLSKAASIGVEKKIINIPAPAPLTASDVELF